MAAVVSQMVVTVLIVPERDARVSQLTATVLVIPEREARVSQLTKSFIWTQGEPEVDFA